MRLFEDINARKSNDRGLDKFERQMEDFIGSVINEICSNQMETDQNASVNTPNDEDNGTSNGSINKVKVVKKRVKKNKGASDNQKDIEEISSPNNDLASEAKVENNVCTLEKSNTQEHYHIKMPDISTIRDGVVWSEILGAPRCKRRYQRYKSK